MNLKEFKKLFHAAYPKGSVTPFKKGLFIQTGPRSKEQYIEGTTRQVAEKMRLLQAPKGPTKQEVHEEAKTLAAQLRERGVVETTSEMVVQVARCLPRIAHLSVNNLRGKRVRLQFVEVEDLFDASVNVGMVAASLTFA
jgi:hypothetical protein